MEQEVKAKVIGYQMTYHKLRKSLSIKDPKAYAMMMVIARFNELRNRGAYMTKCGKPTRKGTTITFEVVKDAKQFQEEWNKCIEDGRRITDEEDNVEVGTITEQNS